MLVEEIKLAVKRDFGDEYDIIINDDDVYRWLYTGELEVIRYNGGNIAELEVSSLDFPVTMSGSITIRRITVDHTKVLVPINREQLDQMALSTARAGTPLYWYIHAEALHVWPVPTVDEDVFIEYNKMPVLSVGDPPVPNTLSVPEAWHTDLISFVLAKAHEKRGNLERASFHQNAFDKNMGKRSQEDKQTDTMYFRGIDPLDYEDYYGAPI